MSEKKPTPPVVPNSQRPAQERYPDFGERSHDFGLPEPLSGTVTLTIPYPPPPPPPPERGSGSK